jgi:hypothetical protein
MPENKTSLEARHRILVWQVNRSIDYKQSMLKLVLVTAEQKVFLNIGNN